MTRVTSSLRQLGVALRTLLVMTVLLGLIYPLAITGISRLVLSSKADGSLVRSGSAAAGSSLIGQLFTDKDGKPLPRYFQTRPSNAGTTGGYDPNASSASNLGPENKDLVDAVTQRRADVAALDGVAPDRVPADALTASGSGLDPDISPAYAMIQVQRVARERNLPAAEVERLVRQNQSGRDLGFIGAAKVNVVRLNLALDALGKG